MRSKLLTLRQAVATVPAGACIALGGFDIVRAPMALVSELLRQGGKRLEVVSAPNPLAVDLLIGGGLVHKATLAFSGFQFEGGFAVGPMWQKAVEAQTLDYREVDAYAILSGLRAAAMGLPFLPLTDIEASELKDPQRWRRLRNPFNGDEITVTEPIEPDIGFVHAQAADRKGNLLIEDPVTDELIAKASRRLIATAETIVERIDRPTIGFYLVDTIVEAPRGAWPSACAGHYGADHDHIALYLKLAREGRFKDYLRRFIA